MLLVIDNYDSFTYNLVHYVGEMGAEPVVYRNDEITVDEVRALKPRAIIISPGPGTPDDTGVCLDVIRQLGHTTPILGVCLGHQAIGQVYGGTVVRAATLMHGKTSPVGHQSKGVFCDLPSPLNVTRYHSLTIDNESVPSTLEVTAETEDGTIMGVRHTEYPVYGVQFHPESIASERGKEMIKNFLDLADAWNARSEAATDQSLETA
ncbi:MAG: aminodeoxychorismate/anthranilate synthase component II [Pseudomonadota bacterium]